MRGAVMSTFLTNVFAGLALRSTYVLVALCFVVIYKSTGVINFAQGGLLSLGAYLGYTFSNNLAIGFGVAILLACAAAAGTGGEPLFAGWEGAPPAFAAHHDHDRPLFRHRAADPRDLGLRQPADRQPVE